MNTIKQALAQRGVKVSIIRRTNTMTNELIDLTKKIEQWAEDRNLHTADPIKQFDKLVEEFGELVKGINKQDLDVIKDSIGDMFVVLVIMSKQTDNSMVRLLEEASVETLRPKHSTVGYILNLSDLGDLLSDRISFIMSQVYELNTDLVQTCGEYYLDFTHCVALAYDEIKDRKGKMIDGKFVKEADL